MTQKTYKATKINTEELKIRSKDQKIKMQLALNKKFAQMYQE